jgi:hypothetical protein
MKLLSILNESINLQNYVWQWLNTGERSINTKIPHSFLLLLQKRGYKKHGTIYRSISIGKKDYYRDKKSGDWRKYIWDRYKGTYSSFAKTIEGAVWFANAMSQQGDVIHIIIKQTSDYMDIFQYFEDNKEIYEPHYSYSEIKGEMEITQECVATLSPNFEVVEIIKA